jgi:hypothetical protein
MITATFKLVDRVVVLVNGSVVFETQKKGPMSEAIALCFARGVETAAADPNVHIVVDEYQGRQRVLA